MKIKKSSLTKSTRFTAVHLLACLLFIALVTGIAASPLLRHHKIQQSHRLADVQSPEFFSPAPKASLRAVYPYSVVPGGVRDVAELKDAMAHDPVVAAHYSGFQLPNLHVVKLDQARLLHVSYRIGARIYWTKSRMTLAKGETVITDGVLMARTRCGNLAAEVIPDTGQPMTLVTEPTVEALDTPLNSAAPVIPTDTFPLESLLTAPVDSPALAVEESSSSSGSLTGPSAGGGSSIGSPGTPPVTQPSTPVPVVSVPEPTTLIQLSVGLLAIGLLWKFARSRSNMNSF